MKGLHHQVTEIQGLENFRLWQRINLFSVFLIFSLQRLVFCSTAVHIVTTKQTWLLLFVLSWLLLLLLLLLFSFALFTIFAATLSETTPAVKQLQTLLLLPPPPSSTLLLVELVQGCVVKLLLLDALRCMGNVVSKDKRGGGEIQNSYIRKILNYLFTIYNIFSYMNFFLLI